MKFKPPPAVASRLSLATDSWSKGEVRLRQFNVAWQVYDIIDDLPLAFYQRGRWVHELRWRFKPLPQEEGLLHDAVLEYLPNPRAAGAWPRQVVDSE